MTPNANMEGAYVPDIIPAEDLEYFVKGGHGERIDRVVRNSLRPCRCTSLRSVLELPNTRRCAENSYARPYEWGETPAVLVIDMTEEFVSDEYAAGRTDTGMRAVKATSDVLEAARRSGHPVFYTKPASDLPTGYRGTTKRTDDEESRRERERGNVIHPTIEPTAEEHVIEKPRASAFFDTHLGNMLHHYGIDTVVVTGLTTSGCVRATVVDAHSSNFRTIVPVNCVADRSVISHEISLFDMDMKYADVTETGEVIDIFRSRSFTTP